MTTKRRARALLIGVESYDKLDSDKQLRAGRNDVLAFWKVCRRLDFAPENIHVFTSPELEVEDLVWAEQELRDELDEYRGLKKIEATETTKEQSVEDQIAARVRGWFPPHDTPRVFLSAATREAILGPNGLKWLAQGEKNNGEQPFDRILTYSGHGTTMAGKTGPVLALCPSDLDENNLDSFISIDTFKEQLQDVDDNMTVVLDCCFAQASQKQTGPDGEQNVATLAKVDSPRIPRFDAFDIQPRVFCAASADEQSYQALIGGQWRSAFSWAFTTVLDRWRVCRDGKPHSTISHIELLFRSRMLLEALSFPQHPVLLDKTSTMPVFGHSNPKEKTSLDANADQISGQVIPDFKYIIYLGPDMKSIKLADVFVVAANSSITLENDKKYPTTRTGDASTGGTEHWYYSDAKLNSIGNMADCGAVYIDVSACPDKSINDFNWSDPDLIVKTSRVLKPADATWSATPTRYPGGTSYYFALGNWGLELNVGKDAQGKLFLNGVQWYQKSATKSATIGGLSFKGKWSKSDAPFDMTKYVAETSI